MFPKSSSVVGQVSPHLIATDNHSHFQQGETIHFSQSLKNDDNKFIALCAESKLEEAEFNGLIAKMNKPEAGILAYWFSALSEATPGKIYPGKERFISVIKLFSQFADLCFKYEVQNCLNKTDKSSFLHKCFNTNYLEVCIAALIGSENKKVQAQLIDQLPHLTLVNAAFTKGLPFICAQMIHNNTIQLQTYDELAGVMDYENYKSNVLVYIARTPWILAGLQESSEAGKNKMANDIVNSRIDFFSCHEFINLLDGISLKQVPLLKKRMLINRFIKLIEQFSRLNTIDEFIGMANKLKAIGDMDYCTKLFGNRATYPFEKELNNYIHISQYLMLGNSIK